MAFHLWDISEVYSDNSGRIQFIELVCPVNSNEEDVIGGHEITFTATAGGDPVVYEVPSNLDDNINTGGRSLLFATQGFADLGLVTPDFIIPGELFLDPNGGLLDVFGVDTLNFASLPTNGTQSLDGSGATVTNSPANFDGDSASIPAAPILGGEFTDTLTGSVDEDFMVGLGGDDNLSGGAGNDTLSGGSGADSLTGGDGNDSISGGVGNDTMAGGAGNDIYVRDATGDSLTESGGSGIDTVQTSLSYTLLTGFERLTLTGTGAITGTGNTGANLMIGNSAANTLNGGGGNDALNGGGGRDRLLGGAGNDTLFWDATDAKADGGGGKADALNVGVNLDLTALPNTRITNIERVNMTHNGSDTLTLNKSEVLDISAQSNVLTVLGDAGDKVNLKGAFVLQSTAGGFETWKNGAAIVKVETELTVL